jgi:hypothetical protein
LNIGPLLLCVGAEIAVFGSLQFGGSAKGFSDLVVITEGATAPRVMTPIGCTVQKRFVQELGGVENIGVEVAVFHVKLDVTEHIHGVILHATSPSGASRGVVNGGDEFVNSHDSNSFLVVHTSMYVIICEGNLLALFVDVVPKCIPDYFCDAFAVCVLSLALFQEINNLLVGVISEAYSVAFVIAVNPTLFYFGACSGFSFLCY